METEIHSTSSVSTTCQNCKKDFTIEPEDFNFYKKIKVPPPTFCLYCRLARRLIWRNERCLYKRNCDLCGKSIIAIYHKESPYKVYCRECWWGDRWNPKDFGVDFDFSKSFFEQYKILIESIPRIALTGTKNVNSDYCNYSLSNKNCYLCFASHYNEDSGYLTYTNKCKFCFDCLHVGSSEFSLECNYCDKLFQCAYLQYSFDCMDCIAGYDLRNCNSCFGCVNLRNKSYNIFNIQHTKEDYESKVKNFLGNRKSFDKAFKTFLDLNARQIKIFSYQKKNNDCTGNDIEESKNVKNSFSVKYSEDSKNLFINCIRVKSCMDVNNVAQDPTELAYEVQGVTNSSNVKFCDTSWDNTFVTYCSLCFSSNNLFGCVGIKKGEFFILNKQYSKKEFNILVPKIIQHMNDMPYIDSKERIYKYGEFFPAGFSPFYYNETISQEYFPLTKNEILEKKYHWRDLEEKNYNITINPEELSKNPSFYDDSILNEVIACNHNGNCSHQCATAFRIIKNELNVYQKIGIPLPECCPNCRHYQRLKQRNPLKLWHRHCMKEGCTNEFETSYAPNRPEIVYCERCYQQEVY